MPRYMEYNKEKVIELLNLKKRSITLSYRRWPRLTQIERDVLNNPKYYGDLGYFPMIKSMAIFITHKLMPGHPKKAIKVAKELYKPMIKFMQSNYIPLNVSDGEALKQLKFNGFIPEKDLPKHFYRSGYGYVQSNKRLDNTIWVYPRRFGSHYKRIEKTNLDINYIFPYIGIEGYTRIKYN